MVQTVRRNLPAVATVLCLSLLAAPSAAGQGGPDGARTDGRPVNGESEALAVSAPLTATLDGKAFAYSARIERTRIEDPQNVFPPADIVSYAYLAEEAVSERPVIFAFNGGPGAASMWNHIGAWGPKRIQVPGAPDIYAPPPWTVEDNPGFLIDVADIVFVDTVSTGLSRTVAETDPAPFYDIRIDARSMCVLVENWLANHDRADAPVFLSGNSYATLRVSGMMGHPACRNMRENVEGLILLSGVLDLRLRSWGNDTPALAAVGQFPTLAAIAWYHGLVDRAEWNGDRAIFLDAAKAFATGELTLAIEKRGTLSNVETTRLAAGFNRFTDLRYPGNVDVWTSGVTAVFDALMGSETGRRPQHYDARFTRGAAERRRGGVLPPMSFEALGNVYLAAFQSMVTDLTGFDTSGYQAMAPRTARVNWGYNYDKSFDGEDDTNMAAVLADMLVRNERASNDRKFLHPDFRILVASGLYDRITPFYAMELALQQAGIPSSVYETYLFEAGHMPHLDPDAGPGLDRAIRTFVTG